MYSWNNIYRERFQYFWIAIWASLFIYFCVGNKQCEHLLDDALNKKKTVSSHGKHVVTIYVIYINVGYREYFSATKILGRSSFCCAISSVFNMIQKRRNVAYWLIVPKKYDVLPPLAPFQRWVKLLLIMSSMFFSLIHPFYQTHTVKYFNFSLQILISSTD